VLALCNLPLAQSALKLGKAQRAGGKKAKGRDTEIGYRALLKPALKLQSPRLNAPEAFLPFAICPLPFA